MNKTVSKFSSILVATLVAVAGLAVSNPTPVVATTPIATISAHRVSAGLPPFMCNWFKICTRYGMKPKLAEDGGGGGW